MRTARGKLSVNLAALRRNYHALQDRVDQTQCKVSAVVKADAYGLGAVEVSRTLIAAGCETFFVANLDEALTLRAAHPGPRIAVLNGFYETQGDLYTQNALTPVLGSIVEIEGYAALARAQNKKLPAFLHFNVRMNRLGLAKAEYMQLFEQMEMLDGLDIQLIMGHFACADDPVHPMNEAQYEVFKEIATHFPDTPKSLSNSSAIFRQSKYHFDLVRPGMALYGLNPTPEKDNPMEAVISLDLPIIRTRTVYEGANIGYSATYRFGVESPVATVSAGYADGLHWSGSNQYVFYWQGFPCPVRGRVSMDLTSVDLSAVPENKRPKIGDFLEVIGPHQSPADLAQKSGSFDYEVLTSLGTRYERVYV